MSRTSKKSSKTRRWSTDVTKHSDALDLQPQVFKGKDPHRIALSLKRSAERSKRRKSPPYQSAMSMLNNDFSPREFGTDTTLPESD
jgi:hypothetical protein